MLQTSLLQPYFKSFSLRRTTVLQTPALSLRRDRRAESVQRCLAKQQQQQEESSETARQVSEAAETAEKVQTFLGGEQPQGSSSDSNAHLPSPEDVVRPIAQTTEEKALPAGSSELVLMTLHVNLQPDRAKQAGVSPWVLGGAGLIALLGLGLGLTSVSPDSVSTIAESSQGGGRALLLRNAALPNRV